jgi:hypothetical protein
VSSRKHSSAPPAFFSWLLYPWWASTYATDVHCAAPCDAAPTNPPRPTGCFNRASCASASPTRRRISSSGRWTSSCGLLLKPVLQPVSQPASQPIHPHTSIQAHHPIRTESLWPTHSHMTLACAGFTGYPQHAARSMCYHSQRSLTPSACRSSAAIVGVGVGGWGRGFKRQRGTRSSEKVETNLVPPP